MQKFTIIALLCLFRVFQVSHGHTHDIKFNDCGNHEVIRLALDNCNDVICIFKPMTRFHLEGEFIANQDARDVEIITENLPENGAIPMFGVPGVTQDGCSIIEGGCPLVKGQRYKISYDMITPQLMPIMKATIRAQLLADGDSSGKRIPLVCVEFSGEVHH